MNQNNILKLSRRELFDFFILTLDLLYEKREVDVDRIEFEFETFFKNSTYIDPLPGNGDSIYYSGRFSSVWFDSKRDVACSMQAIDDEPVFKVLSQNSSIRSAFDIYRQLPIPEEGSAAGEAFIDRLKKNGKSHLVDEYIDRLKVFDFPVMDFHRFCGYVAINYAVYLFDIEDLVEIRKKQKTPMQIRDALLGVQPKPSAKNQSRNGPLVKMINLIESGHGLVDASQNIELLNLLKKLGLQVLNPEVGLSTPSLLFDKRFHVATKRFVQRIGSRICSEFRYEKEKGSLVELLIYHLLHAIELKDSIKDSQDADLRKQVTRDIQPFYEHRNAVYRSWSSDHIPMDDMVWK